MITLRCTNCAETLEVDDAFAGGVCRCRHCGAIQTVPADPEAAASGGEAVPGPAPLYRREEHRDDRQSGLEALADVVASSGMLGSGLSGRAGNSAKPRRGRRPAARPAPDLPPRPRRGTDRRLVAAVAAAAVLAVVASALAVALLAGDDRDAAPEAEVKAIGPNLLGLPLGRRVAFVLDAGQSSAAHFAAVNRRVADAAADLPPGAYFQVIYWTRGDVGGEPVAVPGRGMRVASDANVAEARREMAQVGVGGSTVVGPAFDLALAGNPDTIVLVTGKAADLTPDFAGRVVERWRASSSSPAVHALAAGSGDAGPLRTIAESTGGQYRLAADAELSE